MALSPAESRKVPMPARQPTMKINIEDVSNILKTMHFPRFSSFRVISMGVLKFQPSVP